MVDWTWWITQGALVVAVGAACFNVWTAWQLSRRLRQMQKLDALLQSICLQAFGLRHAPLWRAWSETYGLLSTRREGEPED